MSGSFDVFFSYANRDHAAVEGVARALADRGLRVFLDRWYLTPGQPWPQALEQTLAACGAVAVFVGGGGLGPWQQRERDLALDRQARETGFPVIPVLLAHADPALGFLNLNTWVDLSAGTGDEGALGILAAAIRGEPPGPLARQRSEAARAAVCPYRGLQPFREEDEPFFFGRTAFAETLTGVVLRRSFVAVVGASGSGKSSVVRAGLIPRLRRGAGGLVWDAVTLVPTDRPMVSLAAALLPLLEPDLSEVDRLAEVAKLADHFARGGIALRDVASRMLAKQPGTDRLLLFVDQWEEVYTLCADAGARQAFVGQLLDAAAGNGLSIVLTIRGDFMGRALDDRALADRLQDGLVTIGPMTRDELAETIVQPAERVGLTFQAGLPETILDDVGKEPGGLPLLEFLLEGLWRERRGNVLTLDAYTRLGRVSGAIAHRAEDVFERGLNEAERQAAQRLLMRMVRPGEGVEDTRRRVILPAADAVADAAIQKLAQQRLVVTEQRRDDPERSGDTTEVTVEVAHEALIRNWQRLRDWINADREFLRTRERIADQAQLWKDEEHSADRLLPPGRPLAEGEDLLANRRADLEPLLVDYIEASSESARADEQAKQAAQRRRLGTARLIAAAMTVFSLIAIGGVIFAWWQWDKAEQQRQLADEQRQLADEQGQVAERQRRQALARLLATQARSLEERGEGNDALMQRAANLAIQSSRLMKTGDAYAVSAKLLSWMPATQFDYSGILRSFSLSPDGRFLGIKDTHGFRLIETMSGKVLREFDRNDRTNKIHFDRTGARVLVEEAGGAVRLIDTANGKDVFAAEAGAYTEHTSVWPHGFSSSTATPSPDGRWLALRAASAVKIIDASTGAEAASIDIGDDKDTGYVGVFFHPDGRLVGIETGSSVRLIEIPKVRELSRVPLQDTPEFFFAAGGRSFVVLDCLVNDECNGRLRVIDISTGTETNSIDLGPGVTEADLDGDGRTVHVYTQDTEALFDVVTGEKVPSSKDSLDLALSLGEGCKEQSRMTARDRIVVVCENGRVSTIERATGAEIATFELRGSISHFDGFSPDGRYLLAEDKETYRLYETATGFETTVGSFKIRPPVMFQGRTRLFSEDGQHLIVPTSSQRMQLTDISGPRRATLLEVADLEVFYRNHDERLIAVGRNDRFLRIFEAATGKQHSVLRQAGTVRPFQFSPDGKQMVVTREQAIEIIEVATGEVLASLPQRQQFRIIDSHGRFLIAKSGRSASLIDGKNLREIYRFPLGGSSGKSLKIPALGRGEKTVVEVLSEEEPRKGEEPASVSHFVFSPTGDLLATASPEDRKVRLIETASGKEHLRLDLGRELYDVAFSPDGQMLAVDAFDNTVRLIDVATGKETRRLGYQRGPSYITTAKLRFSKDGRLIAVVDWHGLASRMDERIYAWLFDVGTGQPVAQLMPTTDREGPEEPIGLLGWYVDRFSPDSRYFALGATGDDPVRLVKATTGQEVMSIPLGKGLKGVAFSPDSRYLAAVSESGAATLVVTETGETRGYWRHASAITDRDFSPDSRYFATASADGSVRMVDTENGREVARFEHGSPVKEVYFAAGGRSLITVAEDRRLRLWSTDPNWPFEQLCRRRGRNLSREEWRTLFDSDPWEASCPGWHTPAEDTQAAIQTNSKP